MDGQVHRRPPRLSGRAKLAILTVLAILIVAFIIRVLVILTPFLWALLAAYLLAPLVNYLNRQGRLPRIWAVLLIFAIISLLLVAASRYLYPRIVSDATVFIEDIPRLESSLINLVGPRPFGVDIDGLVKGLLARAGGITGNASTASSLLASAAATLLKLFLFLVATFYLLVDAPRIKDSIKSVLPPIYRDEWLALGQQINLTWQQYLRGELVLFVVMAVATSVGLTLLRVPGAVFIGLASGALELLPLVGPYIAGGTAVFVAYFNGSNPFGWTPVVYGGVVALMYLVFREAEDYFVVPHVLGRAVRLHPLIVLFAVAAGGVLGGFFGLLVAVPIAASVKAILTYIYAKLLDEPIEFAPVQTLGGGVIEIPIHGALSRGSESSPSEGTGSP